MASEAERRELREKAAALVAARFGGDYGAAFRYYDADRDGALGRGELEALLGDAGVGGGWTGRWTWATAILYDLDGAGAVSLPEFAAVFGGGEPENRQYPRPADSPGTGV